MAHVRPSPGKYSDLPVTAAVLRRLAVESSADERSVIKELRATLGQTEHVRGMAGERIRRALARHGYLPRAALNP